MGLREQVWRVISKRGWSSPQKRLKAFRLALFLLHLGPEPRLTPLERMKLEPIVIDCLERAGLLVSTQDGPRALLPRD